MASTPEPASTWSLQDAKNRFSEVVAAAEKTPQMVTKHGRETAVLMSAGEYRRLKQVEKTKKPSLAEMLLTIPQAPADEREDDDIFGSIPFRKTKAREF